MGMAFGLSWQSDHNGGQNDNRSGPGGRNSDGAPMAAMIQTATSKRNFRRTRWPSPVVLVEDDGRHGHLLISENTRLAVVCQRCKVGPKTPQNMVGWRGEQMRKVSGGGAKWQFHHFECPLACLTGSILRTMLVRGSHMSGIYVIYHWNRNIQTNQSHNYDQFIETLQCLEITINYK